MIKLKLIFLLSALLLLSNPQFYNKIEILPAHSHNDYEHEHPLFDALDYNFKSIEADVYSIGDSLFVAHNSNQIKQGRTLRSIYLEPLKKRIQENSNSVYGKKEEFFLLVDVKDDPVRTYQLLHKILTEYKTMLTAFYDGQKTQGAVTVVVSGNRAIELMQLQKVRYAGYDGRLVNLESDISPNLMPMVSDNWSRIFSWDGKGNFSEEEKQKLHTLAEKARTRKYVLRFWGTPGQTHEQKIAVWKELKRAGVGLIGADDLQELHDFLTKESE